MKVHCHPLNSNLPLPSENTENSLDFSQIAREASERIAKKGTIEVETAFGGSTGLSRKKKQTNAALLELASLAMHPKYLKLEDQTFVKELYRLQGFAHLRNQQRLHEMMLDEEFAVNPEDEAKKSEFVLKAATCFYKAMG